MVQSPEINVGPFNHLQPYLYWSICEPLDGKSPCVDKDGNPATVSAAGFGWSFSFGNGFEGTDVQANDLYVMIYFPETPAAALDEAIKSELGSHPHLLSVFLADAHQISSALTYRSLISALSIFVDQVESQRGKALTHAEEGYLISLAEATPRQRDSSHRRRHRVSLTASEALIVTQPLPRRQHRNAAIDHHQA